MANPNYTTPFTSTDYLPDNIRDAIEDGTKPLLETYGKLIDKAVEKYPADPRLLMDPLIRDVILDYTDEEAVNAYFNTLIKTRLGTAQMIKLLFRLLHVDLDTTEWFKSDIPIPPFKFYIDINQYPDIPLTEIIRRVYEVKNERSWLIAVRDKQHCPGYFILDKSKLSSNEYLSRAIGDIIDGVKYCFYFFRKYNYPTAFVEPPSLFHTHVPTALTFPSSYFAQSASLPLLFFSSSWEPYDFIMSKPRSAVETRITVAAYRGVAPYHALLGNVPIGGSEVHLIVVDNPDAATPERDMTFGTALMYYGLDEQMNY